MTTSKDILRSQILALTREYYAAAFPSREFTPGESPVSYAGRVFDADEIESLVDSALDFWLTTGRFAAHFEKQFARYIGVRAALLVIRAHPPTSLAASALDFPQTRRPAPLPGMRSSRWPAGFPTTVNPIIQNGLIPVFVDVDGPHLQC